MAVYTRYPAIWDPTHTNDVSRFHPFRKWITDKQQQQKQSLPRAISSWQKKK